VMQRALLISALILARTVHAQQPDSVYAGLKTTHDSLQRGAVGRGDSTARASLWSRDPDDARLTAGDRLQLLGKRNLTSTQAVARIVLPGIVAQATNTPEEFGRTAEGFGRRIGRNMLSNGSRDVILSVSAAAFFHDPRYQRCACSGFGARIGHALSGIVKFGDGTGGRRFGPANLLASAGAGLVDAHLFETGTVTRQDVARRTSTLLLRVVLTNVAFEFRDDVQQFTRRVILRRN
jgi:hypothetical protein